jgi:hypothetical protein
MVKLKIIEKEIPKHYAKYNNNNIDYIQTSKINKEMPTMKK